MREISQERLIKDARRVLENPFFIPELNIGETYSRLHDDHDGTKKGAVNVTFSEDGDAWVSILGKDNGESLRFRTFFGGGQSPRVRNALMILALAIKLDNDPDPKLKIFK